MTIFYVLYLCTKKYQIEYIKQEKKNEIKLFYDNNLEIIKSIDNSILELINSMDNSILDYYINNDLNKFKDSESKKILNILKLLLEDDLTKKKEDEYEIKEYTINLINKLEKKTIIEYSSIYDLNPELSLLLNENVYSNIVTDRLINENQEKIHDNTFIKKNFIIVTEKNIITALKDLFYKINITHKIYFSSDFKKPINMLINEYLKLYQV